MSCMEETSAKVIFLPTGCSAGQCRTEFQSHSQRGRAVRCKYNGWRWGLWSGRRCVRCIQKLINNVVHDLPTCQRSVDFRSPAPRNFPGTVPTFESEHVCVPLFARCCKSCARCWRAGEAKQGAHGTGTSAPHVSITTAEYTFRAGSLWVRSNHPELL